MTTTDPQAFAEPAGELIEVWLLNFPLQVYARAQEHADGLIREFTHIAQGRTDNTATQTVPARLLAIVDLLTSQYAEVSSEPEAARDDALERGEQYLDLRYLVPQTVAAATLGLAQIFDEADEYCRAGRHLLSLATPPEALAFRRWFLGEFVRQVQGESPVPWTEPDAGPEPPATSA